MTQPSRRHPLWLALLLVLALASIPLLVLEAQSNPAIARASGFANWTIWALFAVDLVVRLFLTNRPKLRYLKTHWFDVVIVVVAVAPLFQPLRALRSARILRLARSFRVVGLLVRFWRSADRVWSGFQGRLVGVAVIVILGALAYFGYTILTAK